MSTSEANELEAIRAEAEQALADARVRGVSVILGNLDGAQQVCAGLTRRRFFRNRNLADAQQVEAVLRARRLRLVASRSEPNLTAVEQLAARNGRWVAVTRL